MAGDTFKRPIDEYRAQNRFSQNEVGLNHPVLPIFMRLRDDGTIEIVGEGCSILMKAGNITLVADTVKVITKDETGGFRWNGKAFNEMADGFQEPALVDLDDEHTPDLYGGVDYYTQDT